MQNESDLKGNEIWLGDDGILRIRLGDFIDDKILEELFRKFKEFGKEEPGRLRVLVNIGKSFSIPSLSYRRKYLDTMKEAFRGPGFKKIAMWGGGKIQKTVTSFAITAAGIKNIKYFNTEEGALEWLKEE